MANAYSPSQFYDPNDMEAAMQRLNAPAPPPEPYLPPELAQQALARLDGGVASQPQPQPQPQAAMQPSAPITVGPGTSDDDLRRFVSTDPRYKPWYDEFANTYGGPPEVNDPDYDYRTAIAGGVVPAPYFDGKATTYHWGSRTPDGKELKSADHPTRWMTDFMDATGEDPHRVGVETPEAAQAYIAARQNKAPPPPRPLTLQQQAQQHHAQSAAYAGEADQAVDQRMTAAGQQGETARATGEAIAAAHGKAPAAEQSYADDMLRAESTRAQAVQEHQQEAEKLRSFVSDYELHDRRTPVEQTMGLIGIALSGLGQAFNAKAGRDPGENMAMKVINERISRDIEAQRHMLAGKRDEAAAHDNAVGRADQLWRDQTQSALALKTAKLGQIDREIEAAKAHGLGETQLAAANGLQGEIRQQQAMTAQQYHDNAAQHIDAKIAANAHAAAAARLAAQKKLDEAPLKQAQLDKLRADTENTQADTAKKLGDANATGGDVLPGYKMTIPLEKPDVTNIRKNAQTVADLKTDLAALKAIREKNGDKGTFNKDDEVTARGIMDRMIGKFTQMSGAGAPSSEERKGVFESLVDPTGHYAFTNPKTVYDRISNQLEDSFHNQLRAIGVQRSSDPRASVVEDGPQSGGAAPASTGVIMVNPQTGDRRRVTDPRAIELGKQHGYQVEGEPQAAPRPPGQPEPMAMSAPVPAQQPDVASMTDQEYAAYVARENGW
jgi:hypothetical protein